MGLSQSEILQAALSQYEQPEVLRILDPGNELLHDLVDRFSRIRSGSKKIEVSCFFELQGSDVGIIVGKELGRVSMLSVLPFEYITLFDILAANIVFRVL